MLRGEGNEKGVKKTTIGLISKKVTLHVQHTFFVHFFAVVLHNYNTIQYNTVRVYCENTLSYNNGVLSQTETEIGVCESTPANLQVFHNVTQRDTFRNFLVTRFTEEMSYVFFFSVAHFSFLFLSFTFR